MPDSLPPDVPRLRVLAVWLELQLAAVRERIAEAERQAAEDAARPRWWITWHRAPPGVPRRAELHRAGCWRPGEPDLHEDDVRQLLAQHPGRIAPCDACHPGLPQE